MPSCRNSVICRWHSQISRSDRVELQVQTEDFAAAQVFCCDRHDVHLQGCDAIPPTGEQELALIRHSGWRAFRGRLPDQPRFYRVLNEDYAIQIARNWNTKAEGQSTCCDFKWTLTNFLSRHAVQTRIHQAPAAPKSTEATASEGKKWSPPKFAPVTVSSAACDAHSHLRHSGGEDHRQVLSGSPNRGSDHTSGLPKRWARLRTDEMLRVEVFCCCAWCADWSLKLL